jgi:cold shock protein
MENAAKRYNGTVKYFNAERGFGFVKAEDGVEYFTHIKDWQRARILGDPRIGTAITFTLTPGTKGPKTAEIELA